MTTSAFPFTGKPSLAAITLCGVAAVEIAAMLFHPHASANTPEARVAAIAAMSAVSSHMHLIMIIAVIAAGLALAELSRRWPSPGWAWMAERLYWLGVGAMVGAALVSGFASGDFAGHVLRNGGDPQVAAQVLSFAFSLNQTLAGFGTLAMSFAVLAWSIGLWCSPARLARAIAVYGVLVGAACCVAYATGVLRLDVTGMTLVVVAHAVWYFAVGLFDSQCRWRAA